MAQALEAQRKRKEAEAASLAAAKKKAASLNEAERARKTRNYQEGQAIKKAEEESAHIAAMQALNEEILSEKEDLLELKEPPPPKKPSLADWKRDDMAAMFEYQEKLAGNISISSKNMIESELVITYQQKQDSNNCGLYGISTALNMLYGVQTTGGDVSKAFITPRFGGLSPVLDFLTSWPKYSYLPDGSATLPSQQVKIINDFAGDILGQSNNLPTAEVTHLTPEEMRRIILDPNKVALFTYNTETGNVFKGHVVTLAAYDATTGEFGFLNSGAQRDPGGLTWKTEAEIENLIQDPIGLSEDNFVVIFSMP